MTALHPPGLPMHVTNQGPLSVPSNGDGHSQLDDEVEPAIEKGAMIARTCKTVLTSSENHVSFVHSHHTVSTVYSALHCTVPMMI